MRRMKAVVSFLLCVLLAGSLLAACGGGGEDDLGNVTYGRYVEEDISPEGMAGYPQTFVYFGNGVFDLISTENVMEGDSLKQVYHRWRSADGGSTWQPVDMSWTEEYMQDYSEYYDKGENPPEEKYIRNMIPFENGDMLVQIQTYTYDEEGMGTESSEIVRLAADGSKTSHSLVDYDKVAAEGGRGYLYEMRALPGGRLYVYYSVDPTEEQASDPGFDYSTTEKRIVCDMNTGETLYALEFNGWQMYYNNTTLFVEDYEKGLQALNIADGTPSTAPLPSAELLQRMTQNYAGSTFVDDANSFYTVNARGMEKIAVGAEEAEEVMDGLNYTYGSPLYQIQSMVYDPDADTLVLAVYEIQDNISAQGKLLRYVWNDEAIATSDKKVTVYSLYENYPVRLALSEYKRKYPEVTIEYDYAFASDSDGSYYSYSGGGMAVIGGSDRSQAEGDGTAMTEEDALRALNTELLNGTGPDVLILDGLPLESFIEKGVLEDLSGIVQDNGDVFEALLAPMYREGKLYALPTNFFIPTLFGEKGYVEQFTGFDTLLGAIQDGAGKPEYREYDPTWTPEEEQAYWQEMYAAKPPEQQPVLYFDSLDDVFNTFYATCAPAIFNEETGIEKQNLASFLQAVKEVSDKYNLADPDQMTGSYGYTSVSVGGYASHEMSQTLSRYSERQSRLGYSRLGSFQVMAQVSFSLYWSAQPDSWGKAVDEDGNPVEDEEAYVPPKADPNTIAAPGIANNVYFPMQIAGVTTTSQRPQLAKDFVATMLDMEVQKHDMAGGFPVTREAFAHQYDNYMAYYADLITEEVTMVPFDYEAVIGTLTTPYYTNDYLRSVISKPVQEYCTGALSLENAVDQIVKETELYFAERQ